MNLEPEKIPQISDETVSIKEVIGEGAQSEVYKVQIGDKVAVMKKLLKNTTTKLNFRIFQIKHKHLVDFWLVVHIQFVLRTNLKDAC